ncbi:MAG: redoxin domain-containing protein [Gemmatimonadaceae bacterium]
MKTLHRLPLLTLFLGAAAQLPAQQPTQSPTAQLVMSNSIAPSTGSQAPDFELPAADSNGATSAPVSLRALRGHVVVLAFYPKDRSGGCTAEMTKFRDEYATLFGDNVIVLPISTDDVTSHAGWAHDMHFPFTLVSDTTGAIASRYSSTMQYQGHNYASRSVYVVGKDGRITYENLHFGALDQNAYDALHRAVVMAAGA